jgi:hypothetical protein
MPRRGAPMSAPPSFEPLPGSNGQPPGNHPPRCLGATSGGAVDGRSSPTSRAGSCTSHPYTEEQILQLGRMLGACTRPPLASRPAWGGLVAMDAAHAPDAVISHCNVGPWHVIMREGRPVGFIDWSLAGPTHPLEELAASGWWNARRGCGDDLAGAAATTSPRATTSRSPLGGRRSCGPSSTATGCRRTTRRGW